MLNPQRIQILNSNYFSSFDREIQEFLFMFLPNLFNDISDNLEHGFTEKQIRVINTYFDNIITLAAIVYPRKRFIVIGDPTYKLLRKLNKIFHTWLKACAVETTSLSHKRKILERMHDCLAKLSKCFHEIRKVTLSDEKQHLLLNKIDHISEVVQDMGNIGLKSIDIFLERRRRQNLPVVEEEQDDYEDTADQTIRIFLDKLKDVMAELVEYTPSDPKPETGLTRMDIYRAKSRIIGIDNAVILDLGCGSGPLLQALDLIDPDQKKTLYYIGVNYKNITAAYTFAEKKDLFSKLGKISLYTLDEFEPNSVQADFVFMIDILHHLCPADLDKMVNAAITTLKNNKDIIIIESLKYRELDKFHWTPSDIKYLFNGYSSSLKVYSYPEIDTHLGIETPVTIASIKKMNDVVIGPDFKDRCLALFKRKLKEINNKIKAIESSDKERYEKISEIAPLIFIRDSIFMCMHESQEKWLDNKEGL